MMSAALHPTRYWWDGRRGIARHEGVEVVMTQPPEGLRYHSLDYVPGLVAECRERACDPPRDLEAEEVQAHRRLAGAA